MVSARQFQIFEDKKQEISNRLIRAIRANPGLTILSARPDAELREWCEEILTHIGSLSGHNWDEKAARRFEALGRMRFAESVPLHEAVLRAHLLRQIIADLLHELAPPLNTFEYYAQAELDKRLDRFFECLVYGVVLGYELALQRARRLAC
jgi:signal transduction histidine kinase